MKELNNANTLVVLSGGQDSVTCLMQASKQRLNAAFDDSMPQFAIHSVSFTYGQRHGGPELMCAQYAHEVFGAGSHTVLELPALQNIADSALVTNGSVTDTKDGLPASFVPGRNLIMLSTAAALAYKLNCGRLVTGVNEVDYSGYPDCRGETIAALNNALRLGMETNIEIVTPLITLTKKDIWLLAYSTYGRKGIEFIRDHTHTCYNGDHTTKHAWGYGCDQCPACLLRKKGFEDAVAEIEGRHRA